MEEKFKGLGCLLLDQAVKNPSRTCLIFGGRKLSFREIHEKASLLSQLLKKHSINKGDKVALWTYNCPEYVVSYFAVLYCGGVVVPVNAMFKREEARHVIADSGAGAVICCSERLDDVVNLNLRLDTIRSVFSYRFNVLKYQSVLDIYQDPVKAGFSPQAEIEDAAGDDTAQIIYTSGTTGKPKGACLSHGNVMSNVRDCSSVFEVKQKDTFICILPMYHAFSLTVTVLLPLYKGSKIVVFRSVAPFRRVIRSIRKNRISIFVAVPPFYNLLKDKKISWAASTFLMPFMNPLRLCISGASPLASTTISAFEKKFKVPLLEGYGLTEASPVVSFNPSEEPRPGSVGRPLPSVEVKIVDSNCKQVVPGAVGELLVRGPNVMRGYYKQPESDKEIFADGWLRTGDLCRMDKDGYIYIEGRLKEMINVRGMNVYPKEIEELLYTLSYIKEAAVIGVNHPRKGEVPVVFVVPEETAVVTSRNISAFLKDNLAVYKLPYKIEIREELPKNSTGKILKYVLKQDFERGMTRSR